MEKIINYLSFIKQDSLGFSEPFGQQDIIFFLIILIFIILIYNYFSRRKILNRVNKIPGLQLNDKIFTDIKRINENIDRLNIHKHNVEQNFINIYKSFKNNKIVKFKKYNPYLEMGVGGNQSFSIAFVSGNGEGIIMTSLYSRERTRVVLKEVNNFIASQELSEEEKEVLEKVRNHNK